jgi:hypothetical protein
LNAFWVDEKGAHKGAQEVGEVRGQTESDSMRNHAIHSIVRPTYRSITNLKIKRNE